MNEPKLIQFQCEAEGTLFYYQHSPNCAYLVERCPLCGSMRVAPTGRLFPAIDETAPKLENRR